MFHSPVIPTIGCQPMNPPRIDPDCGVESSPSDLRRRVLLVDDNLDEQRLLRRILTLADVDVTLECNGQAAVDRIFNDRNSDSSKFDLILMDLRMPVLDGCEATRELRSGGYEGAIAIVTAFDDHAVREAAFDAGCDEFLTKPVPRPKLLDVVKKYAAASAE